MNNEKPKDPLYPNGFKQTQEMKTEIYEEFKKPRKKDEEDELTPLKKLNHKIGIYLSPKSTNITDDERKRKIGVIITTLIILTLVISAYYFLIYEPSQEELSLAKTMKLNELHDLYSGALTTSPNAMIFENKINDARSPEEVGSINIILHATKDWRGFHKNSISLNQDKYNRIMAVYSNESKNIIIPTSKAMEILDENDATILSKIKFEEPNTVSVPILVSRLQAGAGLVSVGSIVDIYSNANSTEENSSNNTTPVISGCTVLSIMRYEENGEIDSEYSKSRMTVNGNTTHPIEKTKSFSSDVLEMIKGAIINGYDEEKTFEMLENYGVKLSNYERQINLGDLDAQYMLLIETPQDKVNFILNNMDNIVLTIPTSQAPDWMVNEISSTYHYWKNYYIKYNKTDIMKKPTISTIIVIICLIIIGLYAMGEVNYFSSKIIVEKNIEAPIIVIPSIGVEEKINNVSLNQGVMSDPGENIPTQDPVILYGHRTLQGSPFLRLNELSAGDTFLLEWPGIGELNYTIVNYTVVPASFELEAEGENNVYLITCDPIGSTENRIIIQSELVNKNPINNEIIKNNPQESNALIISALFLIIGGIFSYLYPKENRIYILISVLIISAILFYCCINPIPSEIIYDKIIFLNGGLWWTSTRNTFQI